jgi:hypothetical protein
MAKGLSQFAAGGHRALKLPEPDPAEGDGGDHQAEESIATLRSIAVLRSGTGRGYHGVGPSHRRQGARSDR